MGLFDKFRKKVRDAASDIDSESISAEDGTQEAIDALAKHGENKIESPIESGYEDDWEDIADDEELNLPSTNDDDWDDWDDSSADWDDVIPVSPCHWDDIMTVDGGWLPQWDEALDELTGKIEAVYFASYLYGGRSPPYN